MTNKEVSPKDKGYNTKSLSGALKGNTLMSQSVETAREYCRNN